MLKRIISLVIIFLLLLPINSCNTDKEATRKNNTDFFQEFDVDISYEIFDCKVDSNSLLYLADKSFIHVLNDNGNEIKTIGEELGFCRNIALWDNEILAFDDKNNIVKAFDSDGIYKTDISFSFDIGTVIKMDCLNEYIILMTQSETDTFDIYTFSLKTKQINKINIKDIKTFCIYNDDTILLYIDSANNRKFIYYDIKSDKSVKEIDTSAYIYKMCYDSKTDNLYYISSNQVKCLSNNKTTDELIYFNNSYIFSDIYISDKNIFVTNNKDKKVVIKLDKEYFKKYSQANSGSVLTIYTSDNSMIQTGSIKNAIKFYEDRFPGNKVQLKFFDKNIYENTINTKLMAKDHEPDIFVLDSGNIKKYVNSGFLMNLNEDNKLDSLFGNMFDGIKILNTDNNMLFGVPWRLMTKVFCLNEQLLGSLQLNMPDENWTWNDFYEFSKLARKDLNGDNKKDTYLISIPKSYLLSIMLDMYNIKNYNLNHEKAFYSNNEFVDLLKLFNRLTKDELLDIVDAKDFYKVIEKQDNVLLRYSSLNLFNKEDTYIPLPAIDKNQSYPFLGSLLCGNKNTKNKVQIGDFIAEYLSEQIQSERGSAAPIYEESALYEKQSNERLVFDTEAFSLYKSLVNRSRYQQNDKDIQENTGLIMKDFLEGRIDEKTAALLIDEKVQMILME